MTSYEHSIVILLLVIIWLLVGLFVCCGHYAGGQFLFYLPYSDMYSLVFFFSAFCARMFGEARECSYIGGMNVQTIK